MLLQYCSDLHLEFLDNRRHLAAKPLLPRAKVLILAGDILPLASLSAHKDYLHLLSDSFSHIYWLPGNHEYYGGDLSLHSGAFQENISTNLTLLNNTVVEEADVRLIFTTLWTYISPAHREQIEHGLNDYRLINFGSRKLRAADLNQLHAESLAFLTTELNRPTAKKTVVVTHSVPTFFHYPEVYKGDVLNEAFGVELFPLIHDSSVAYWIYGHHHFNIPDFHIGNTVLTTNQLGYVHRNEHRGFAPDRTIDL